MGKKVDKDNSTVPPSNKNNNDNGNNKTNNATNNGDNGGINLGGNPGDKTTAEMQAGIAGFMALANQSAGQLGTVQNQQSTAASEAERLKKQFGDENNGNFSI
ncbi:hypothetical protein QN362_10610 [Actimicrobium sp. CCC2.4]|uniref:hypothetical protein n=1 Tax=Actimicrobium sp. CCC2.4 TaxID=3048606 RepID=UPI002AC9CE64|nr:hypothetical protein [Actimicrobium sp. CCC2.4]MEB0135779.1 hypothetical protein [Actimicrobium sp. CCC2.4]WPX33260.1 hypothetical protein RHM62_05315 [Actimicrobium sp. CCC2.4]